MLNYFGQGALILRDEVAIENPFFCMAPDWSLFPLVLLSTAATVIASQAVISGAFSLSRQAIQLGLMPLLDIFQTSTRARGQIYIPQVNWLLLIAVLALVLGFQSSSALASAYGFAVTGTMTITTILAAAVMRGVWRWQWTTVAAVLVPIMTVDLALFGANALKIPSGGWFPLVFGLVVFTIMTTWRTGRRLVLTRLGRQAVPLASFLATCEEAPEARVSGTAVFLITQTENVPVTLLHNLKHNKVRHHTVLLVRVVTENIPRVAGGIGNEALDDFELGLERFGFLDRDHPLVADPLHCLLASIGALGRKASSILCLISAGVGLTPGLLLLVVPYVTYRCTSSG